MRVCVCVCVCKQVGIIQWPSGQVGSYSGRVGRSGSHTHTHTHTHVRTHTHTHTHTHTQKVEETGAASGKPVGKVVQN